MKCDGWIITAVLYVFAPILIHFGGTDWNKMTLTKCWEFYGCKNKTKQNKDSCQGFLEDSESLIIICRVSRLNKCQDI